MLVVKNVPLLNVDGGMMGGGGGEAPAPQAAPQATPTITPQPGAPLIAQNPLLQQATNAGAAPEQPPAAVTPEFLDFAGRKVPVVDPVIRDLHKDYGNLTRAFQESNTSLKQMQEQVQLYQQMQQMQQMQQQQQQQQQPPQQPQGPTPEQMQEFTQKYMDTFYENPVEANKMMMESPFVQDIIQRQVENLVKPFIEPIQKERQYTAEVQQLAQKYNDFQEMVPAMQQLLQQDGNLVDRVGLENVYLIARGQMPQQQQYTPEQMLHDPNFRQQILGDEQLKTEFFNQYMQQRQQTNQQTPTVIGTQPGGTSPAMPENRPKTLREGSNMFSRFLGIGN